MIVGSKSTFAIESGITRAYERVSFRALGFFVLHIGGQNYGVRATDASMLACSLTEIEARIVRRNTHVAPFATGIEGSRIADAVRKALYAPNQEEERFFGISGREFSDLIYSKNILWAPDGDEAFDDGSHVLHIDFGDQVRLIGFRCSEGYHYDPKTLTDIWLPAADFYRVLHQWRNAFLTEWQKTQKTPEEEAP